MNGKQIELENATVDCINEYIERTQYETFDESLCFTQQRSYELEVSVGNITKKRFIKLLMAKGIQRNGAVEMANYFYRKFGCYNPLYLITI